MTDLDIEAAGLTETDLAEFCMEHAGEPPAGQKCECPEHDQNYRDADLNAAEESADATNPVFTRRDGDGKVCVWWWCELCYEAQEPLALDEWIAEEGWPDDGSGEPERPDRCILQEAP